MAKREFKDPPTTTETDLAAAQARIQALEAEVVRLKVRLDSRPRGERHDRSAQAKLNRRLFAENERLKQGVR